MKHIVKTKGRILFLALLIVVISGNVQAQDEEKIFFEISGNVSTDHSLFFKDGLYEGQEKYYPSIAADPEFTLEFDDGAQRVIGHFFGRLNAHDSERSHWDIRELYYQLAKNNWELNIGLKKIFWGVTEIAHLVDVINQTDLVESFDGEQKFGQPMVQFTGIYGFGTVDAFVLPYFRERSFPGRKGRLRPSFVLDTDNPVYESDSEENHIDFALRYSNSIGIFDLGLYHFYGTNREPVFAPQGNGFVPLYEIMNQTGLDVQATTGSFLWKFEGIYRNTEIVGDVFAFDFGTEYTFANVNGKGLDIGVLAEYMFDDRGETAPTGLDNDLFFGARFGFNDINDSSILFGAGFDLEQSGKLVSVEAQRRFFQSVKAEIELRLISDPDPIETLYFLRDDSFARLILAWYF